MRFITITLIVHAPDPVTGEQKSTQDRFQEFGHSVLHLHADAGGLTDADPPWGWGGGPAGDDAINTGAVKTGTVAAPATAGG